MTDDTKRCVHGWAIGHGCQACREHMRGLTDDTKQCEQCGKPMQRKPYGWSCNCGPSPDALRERERIKRIVEGVRALHTSSVSDIDEPYRNLVTRQVCDALLAAIDARGYVEESADDTKQDERCTHGPMCQWCKPIGPITDDTKRKPPCPFPVARSVLRQS